MPHRNITMETAVIRSSAPSATALALAMGAALLSGCGAKSDQEQAAAAQAAAERAEAAAERAEKAAGMVSKATNAASSSESDAEAEHNEDGQAVAGPPQPSEEDVRRAVEEAESR